MHHLIILCSISNLKLFFPHLKFSHTQQSRMNIIYLLTITCDYSTINTKNEISIAFLIINNHLQNKTIKKKQING